MLIYANSWSFISSYRQTVNTVKDFSTETDGSNFVDPYQTALDLHCLSRHVCPKT